jgi:hypothetical protein
MESDSPSTAEKPPKLRWFQYRLRSLFILTTLVAIACSWLSTKIQQKQAEHRALEVVKRLGASEAELGSDEQEPEEPRWWQKLIGNDSLDNGYEIWFHAIELDGLGGDDCTDSDLAKIPWRDLRRLRCVYIFSRKVTDEGLHNLEDLKSIEYLLLVDTKITDGAIERFRHAFPKCYISRKADAPVPE